MSRSEAYKVFALRYAHHAGRSEADNIIGGDPHSGDRPLDYFIWAIHSPARTIVVDTGFSALEAAKRGRTFLNSPDALLAMIGIDANRVQDVIITHLHYDHAGNQALFQNARFHIQDSELAFATGRAMTHPFLRGPFDSQQVADMVQKLFMGRVVFHDGFGEIAPGVEVHRIGGHTAGLQVVRVHTTGGCLVLASDAAHLYGNLAGRPFPIVVDVLAMLEGHRQLRVLAGESGTIVPGHDPEVMRRFPAADGEHDRCIVRLDLGEYGQLEKPEIQSSA